MHPFSDADLLARQGEQQAAARSDGAEGDEARVEPLQAQHQSGGRGKIRGAQAVVRQEPRGAAPVRHEHGLARHGVAERVAAVAQRAEEHPPPAERQPHGHDAVRRVAQSGQQQTCRGVYPARRQHERRERYGVPQRAGAHAAVLQQLQPVYRAAQRQRHSAEHRREPQRLPPQAEGHGQQCRRHGQLASPARQNSAPRQIHRHGVGRAERRSRRNAPGPDRRRPEPGRRAQQQPVHRKVQREHAVQIDRHGRTPLNEYVDVFENDVEMYGAQTSASVSMPEDLFENDVEMYGAQTNK